LEEKRKKRKVKIEKYQINKRLKAENNFENWDIKRYIKNSLISFCYKAKEINATNVFNKFNLINSDYGVVFK